MRPAEGGFADRPAGHSPEGDDWRRRFSGWSIAPPKRRRALPFTHKFRYPYLHALSHSMARPDSVMNSYSGKTHYPPTTGTANSLGIWHTSRALVLPMPCHQGKSLGTRSPSCHRHLHFRAGCLGDKKLATLSRVFPAESSRHFKDSYVIEFLSLPAAHSETDFRRVLWSIASGKQALYLTQKTPILSV